MSGRLDRASLHARLVAIGLGSDRAAEVAAALEPRLRALWAGQDPSHSLTAPATSFSPMTVPSPQPRFGQDLVRRAASPPSAQRGAHRANPFRPVGAAEASTGLANGSATSVSLLEAALEVVARTNPTLRAFVNVDEDTARTQAAASDGRRRRRAQIGRADGIALAVKDVIDVRGFPTTAGSRVLANQPPARRDAEAVARLRAAGVVVLGKTHTHEFALGGTGENGFLGNACNPWDPSCVTGGSSSGSAVAVATGMAHAALGTDAGGSVRGPAALCGVVGFKPTFGLVSLDGAVPSGWSLDHLGTLSPRVADARLLLGIMTDRLGNARVPSTRPLRVGVPRRFFFDLLAPDVAGAIEGVIDRIGSLGWEREELDWPDRALAEAADSASWTINAAEAAAYHDPWLDADGDAYGDDVRARLELGMGLLASEYLRAQRLRRHVQEALSPVWSSVDLLLTPACPVTAFRHGQVTVEVGGGSVPAATTLNRCFRIANMTGWPAITIPCGFGDDGLPIGVQLLAPPMYDDLLLDAAEALEGTLQPTAQRAAS